MSGVEADMAWLTANTVTWSLEVNPERGYYEPRREWITEHGNGDEDMAALLAATDLYEARCYPDTPVGFILVFGTTAAEALAALRAARTPEATS